MCDPSVQGLPQTKNWLVVKVVHSKIRLLEELSYLEACSALLFDSVKFAGPFNFDIARYGSVDLCVYFPTRTKFFGLHRFCYYDIMSLLTSLKLFTCINS